MSEVDSPQLSSPIELAGEHPAGHTGANAKSKPFDRREGERDAQTERLVWRCRRGLLELDLWLGGFLGTSRATLHPDEVAAFERLLAQSDMHILDWLHVRTPCEDTAIRTLLERLRNYRAHPNRDPGDEQNSHPQFQ